MRTNLDDIIYFDTESTNLDFKKEEYKKGNYAKLLKDVMSMANALNDDVKRIIIGVKLSQDSREFYNLVEMSDPADLENLIQENIEPTINFSYYPYILNDSTRLGVIELFNNTNRPYMMRKDYQQELKKGDMWIRKGTRNSRVTRSDLDRMWESKANNFNPEAIKIGYSKQLLDTFSLKISTISRDELPSSRERQRLQERLDRLVERYYGGKRNKESSENQGQTLFRLFAGTAPFGEFDDEKKAIRVGWGPLNNPYYMTKDQLQEAIAGVANDYKDYDNYYIFNQAQLLNFFICNNGSEFLEDVRITMEFDSSYFVIASEIYHKPINTNLLSPQPLVQAFEDDYPDVISEDGKIVVQDYHNVIRHKDLTEVFGEDLRVHVKPDTQGTQTDIHYSISAKNLPELIEGNIHVLIGK